MALEVMHQAVTSRQGNTCRMIQNGGVWVDGIGFVGIWIDGTHINRSFYGAAQLDGEVIRITSPVYFLANFSYDYAEDGLLVTYYGGVAGRRWKTKPEGNLQEFLYSSPDLPLIDRYDIRLADRWLKASGSSIYQAPLDGSLDWAIEHTYTADNQAMNASSFKYFSGSARISAAGGGLYWLAYHYGGLALYDATNKQVIESHKVAFNYHGQGYLQGLSYSRGLGVFIGTYLNTSTNKTELVVMSDETRPSSLSNPVALSTLSRGSVTTMEVELMGENNDPVEDFPVDWTLTVGDGQLSSSQTLTDATGKAQVDYLPDNLASSGFTLQAEAQF
ncbi:MAG: hypothetical protein U9Q19_02710 [Pseudomonadota bacterium]|nr:hypothetical protein [Pseudomonadota bacterium]